MKYPAVELGELVDVVMGQAPPGDACNKDGNGTIFVKAGEFQEHHPVVREWTTKPLKLSKSGDVLVCVVGATAGKVNQSAFDCAIGRSVAAVRSNPQKLDSRFLYHFLKTKVMQLRDRSQGAAQGVITKEMIFSLSVALLPLPEQRRIAAILDQADALRAKRREALAQLDSLTQSIFIDMFGDPVTNPKGWPAVNLGALIQSASDGPHVSPTYAEMGIPFLSARHVRPGEISWHDMKYLTQSEAEIQWKKCKPTRGDILYTKGGTTGFAAIVNTDIEFTVWVHIALLKPNKAVVNSKWLEAMLNSPYCYRQSQDLTHGVANRDLGLKRMVKILMYHPPLKLQCEFAHRMEHLANQRLLQQRSLAKLGALFASLQHRAFRGEL